MGQLRHVFGSAISFKLKMKIYKTAVCSLLTYGCEAWDMDVQTMAKINGANARLLSRFTGKDAHAEASEATRSFDLVQAIRLRRFRWLGHILRMSEGRLVKLAARTQFERQSAGGLFMDLPSYMSYDEVQKLARCRKTWKALGAYVGNLPAMAKRATKKLSMLRRQTPASKRKRQVKITFFPSPATTTIPGASPSSTTISTTTTTNTTTTTTSTTTSPSATIPTNTPPTSTSTTHMTTNTASTPTATNILQRLKWASPKRRKKKTPAWTNKQRQAWARRHYAERFEPVPSALWEAQAEPPNMTTPSQKKPKSKLAQKFMALFSPSSPSTPSCSPEDNNSPPQQSVTDKRFNHIHMLYLQRRKQRAAARALVSTPIQRVSLTDNTPLSPIFSAEAPAFVPFTPTAPDRSLWAEPCVPPSDSSGSLWAEPCEPPSESYSTYIDHSTVSPHAITPSSTSPLPLLSTSSLSLSLSISPIQPIPEL